MHGVKNEVWDYASNAPTASGAVYIGTERGQGTYVQDTGRIVMTLDTRVAQFIAGPHEASSAAGSRWSCVAAVMSSGPSRVRALEE